MGCFKFNDKEFDYYPFGSAMKDRTFEFEFYKFGFNGQEKDDKIKGEGNTYAFKHRIYDTRLGRFLSTDPTVISN